MEYVHCRLCGHWPNLVPDVKLRYFIGSCGYLYCQNCLNAQSNRCANCKGECKLTELNAQAPTEIKTYFSDPLHALKDALKTPIQILQFQQSLHKNAIRVSGKMLQAWKMSKLENESLKKEMQNLRKCMDDLQSKSIAAEKRCDDLKRQNDELTKKLNELQQRPQHDKTPVFLMPSPLSIERGGQFTQNSDPLNLFGETPIPNKTAPPPIVPPKATISPRQKSIGRTDATFLLTPPSLNSSRLYNAGCAQNKGPSQNSSRLYNPEQNNGPSTNGEIFSGGNSAFQRYRNNHIATSTPLTCQYGSPASVALTQTPQARVPERIVSTNLGTPTPRLISRLRNIKCTPQPTPR